MSFYMPEETHRDLNLEAEHSQRSKASICREALSNYLAQPEMAGDKSGVRGQSEESSAPWYVRYRKEIQNFHSGPAPKTPPPAPSRSCEDRDEITELWDR